jgi:hypothetical protein
MNRNTANFRQRDIIETLEHTIGGSVVNELKPRALSL